MNIKTFYRSDKWRNLVAQLKLERLNEDGQLICEHCGKPITRSYDCIGHHVVELTEENVDDASVSLNPENIKLIHFKCHNEMHNRFNGWKGQKVYLVYGSPCSGKTSWVNANANADDLIVDVDRLWDAVCNGGRYDGKTRRSNRIKSNVLGLRDCLIEQIMMRKGMWPNAFIIGGYPLRTERDRLCDLLNAEAIYIDATKEECLKRCESERPAEWKEYIEDWFAAYVE